MLFRFFGGHFKFKFVASLAYLLITEPFAFCRCRRCRIEIHGDVVTFCRDKLFSLDGCTDFLAVCVCVCGLHFTAHLFICHFFAAGKLLLLLPMFTWGLFPLLMFVSSLFFLSFLFPPLLLIYRDQWAVIDWQIRGRLLLLLLQGHLPSDIAYWLERVYLKMLFCVSVRIAENSAMQILFISAKKTQ